MGRLAAAETETGNQEFVGAPRGLGRGDRIWEAGAALERQQPDQMIPSQEGESNPDS